MRDYRGRFVRLDNGVFACREHAFAPCPLHNVPWAWCGGCEQVPIPSEEGICIDCMAEQEALAQEAEAN